MTHNMQQAQRLSDTTIFMYLGDIEEADTAELFNNPKRAHPKLYKRALRLVLTGH